MFLRANLLTTTDLQIHVICCMLDGLGFGVLGVLGGGGVGGGGEREEEGRGGGEEREENKK